MMIQRKGPNDSKIVRAKENHMLSHGGPSQRQASESCWCQLYFDTEFKLYVYLELLRKCYRFLDIPYVTTMNKLKDSIATCLEQNNFLLLKWGKGLFLIN